MESYYGTWFLIHVIWINVFSIYILYILYAYSDIYLEAKTLWFMNYDFCINIYLIYINTCEYKLYTTINNKDNNNKLNLLNIIINRISKELKSYISSNSNSRIGNYIVSNIS